MSAQTISKDNLKKVIMVDEAEFVTLVKAGVLKKGEDGKEYLFFQSIQSYITHLQSIRWKRLVKSDEIIDSLLLRDKRELTDLTKEKVIVKDGAQNYEINESALKYIKHIKQDNQDDAAKIIAESQVRKALADADRAEEEARKVKRLNDIEEATVVPSELLIEFMGPLSGQTNRTLDNIILDFRDEFGESFNSSIEHRVKKKIDDCKSSYAKAHKELIKIILAVKSEYDEQKISGVSEHRTGLTEAPIIE